MPRPRNKRGNENPEPSQKLELIDFLTDIMQSLSGEPRSATDPEAVAAEIMKRQEKRMLQNIREITAIMDRLQLRLSPSSEPTKTKENPADTETEFETENDEEQRKMMETREQATVRSQLRQKNWNYIIEFHQRWMSDGSVPYVTLPCFESDSLTKDIKNFFSAISASFDDVGLADDHPIRGRILSLNSKSQFTLYLELNAENKKNTEANSIKGRRKK